MTLVLTLTLTTIYSPKKKAKSDLALLLSELLAQGTGSLAKLLVLVLSHLDPSLTQYRGHVHGVGILESINRDILFLDL